jgi:peptidoglycan/xylan/chitin deacetylase (PgdA/CDA1 family)
MFKYWVKTPFWLKMFFPGGLVWNLPAAGEPTVYITFDDGPHPFATPFALQQLAKYNAKATFFCVGENVTKYPSIYEEVHAQGHATANHTFNHLNGRRTKNDAYLQNIQKAAEHIDSKLFRPPYGIIRGAQARALKKDNWKIVMWSVLSGDFDRKISAQKCMQNVVKHIKPGSVVLFHDSEKAWPRMSYALPHVLEHCTRNGWAMKVIPA